MRNRIRSFAACCGTHLFFEETKDSDTIDVTIASLDDPAPFAPQKAIWLEDKLPWVAMSILSTRVKYRPGEKIEFPDFTIEYVGERRKSVPVYPRGFLYYDFKVSKGKVEKVVSQTTGTGDIGPVEFEIGGKRFLIELRHSDKLGKLKDNKLVIWQANPPS